MARTLKRGRGRPAVEFPASTIASTLKLVAGSNRQDKSIVSNYHMRKIFRDERGYVTYTPFKGFELTTKGRKYLGRVPKAA